MLDNVLLKYEATKTEMKSKLSVGLITEDEYYAFLLKEDTMWNLMDVKPNRMTLVKKR